MPFAGRRDIPDANLNGQGTFGLYWSSSPSSTSSDSARRLLLSSANVEASSYNGRAYGFSVRSFKDSYVTPTSAWTVVQGTLGSA